MSRDKADARREARRVRAGLDPQQRAAAEAQIHLHLEVLVRQRAVQMVGVYASAGSEVDLSLFIEGCLEGGVTVAWPRVAGPGVLSFHVLDSAAGLISGWRDIAEPPRDTPEVSFERLDVVLVPGLCFDRSGRRLGQGAGFYDRLIATCPSLHTVGVAFGVQVLSEVPTEEHDARVRGLVTEGGYHPVPRTGA